MYVYFVRSAESAETTPTSENQKLDIPAATVKKDEVPDSPDTAAVEENEVKDAWDASSSEDESATTETPAATPTTPAEGKRWLCVLFTLPQCCLDTFSRSGLLLVLPKKRHPAYKINQQYL